MFAPRVAKPKTKSAPSSNNNLTLQRSAVVGKRPGNDPVEQAHLLQRSTGNQAMPQNEPGAQDAASSWDLSTIPVFSPGHVPVQAELKVGTVNDPMEHEADRVADRVIRMPTPEVSAAA